MLSRGIVIGLESSLGCFFGFLNVFSLKNYEERIENYWLWKE